jgi:hypothetical protein
MGSGARRGDDVHLEADELGHDLVKAFAVALTPAVFNRDGAAIDPAQFSQPLIERSNPAAPSRCRA